MDVCALASLRPAGFALQPPDISGSASAGPTGSPCLPLLAQSLRPLRNGVASLLDPATMPVIAAIYETHRHPGTLNKQGPEIWNAMLCDTASFVLPPLDRCFGVRCNQAAN
jgi:hypothetical protein